MGMEVDMNKQRIEWIDVCKGILIITIVLMHIDFSFWQGNKIGKYICDFTSLYKVAIFFCVAGLTLKDEKLKETKNFIFGKIKNLWMKVVIVGLLAVVSHNFLIFMGFYEDGFNYNGKIMFAYKGFDFIKQSILTLFMANREVIIGPMWYADVLFMALVLLAIIDFICRLIVRDEFKSRIARLIFVIVLMMASSALTNILGITIPRFNNTLTAAFLIDECQFVYSHLKWKFSKNCYFIISICIFLNMPLYGKLSLTNNYFVNPAFLIVVSLSGMYMLYYISIKIEKHIIGKWLAKIGRQSFWIMAFHFFAFKIASWLLNLFMEVDIGRLTPYSGTIFSLLFYSMMGIFIPYIIGCVIQKTKKMVEAWKS